MEGKSLNANQCQIFIPKRVYYQLPNSIRLHAGLQAMDIRMKSKYLRIINLINLMVLISLINGCSLVSINNQTKLIENMGRIEGKVFNQTEQKGKIILVLFRKENNVLIKRGRVIAPEKGNFSFDVFPGEFLVAAYIDKNHNQKYDKGEYGQFYSEESIKQIEVKQRVTIPDILIKGLPESAPDNVQLTSEKAAILKNIGKTIHLDDPIFSEINYSLGMWQPLNFLRNVGGGLFFLAPYDETKIPVLFIHGIRGGPTDFESMIKQLDKRRFQPFVLYYPSGLRLDTISDYMSLAVSELQNKHQFKTMLIVGHSMGGLISRSFLKKYYKRYPEKARAIKTFISINSPMSGIDRLTAVEKSPVIIPVWNDLMPDSAFINEINQWRLPGNTRYHLVFSYVNGKDSDGMIKLHSQLPYNLQTEAVRIYGFNANHVGALQQEELIDVIINIINQSGSKTFIPQSRYYRM